MDRANKYATTSDIDSIEELSKRLTNDLRNLIRMLGNFPVMSQEWKNMANTMGRIGAISEMERKMPKKKDASLWECEEMALRYVLEDGKLNLCLRMLVEYQEFFERETRNQTQFSNEDQEIMKKFESGCCVVLKNAWMHSEALQTTEIQMLVEYIASVLNHTVEYDEVQTKKEFMSSPKLLVVYFLFGLTKGMDEIGETRVMPMILEHRIFSSMVSHVKHLCKRMEPEDLASAAEALAIICDTEEFENNAEEYIETKSERVDLAAIKGLFINDLTKNAAMRRKLRPLMDVISEYGCNRK